MQTQFKKGVLELLVLTIVSKKRRYGYELISSISGTMEISEGTIYPLLRRLTKEGYFETTLEPSEGGPPRKYYQLTSQGKKRLNILTAEWTDFTQAVDKILKNEGETE